MKILAIGPHPDDVELGCGGTLAKLADTGHSVFILHMSQGPTSRGELELDQILDIKSETKAKANRAAQILGAEDVFLCDFPDNAFDTTPIINLAAIVERHIKLCKPDIIYGPWVGDLNQDHSRLAHAIHIATRPFNGTNVATYAYEVLSSSEWTMLEPFKPNTYVDISNYMDQKQDAVSCYDTEVNDFPHPRSHESIKALAMKRGSESGLMRAEAFQLIRSIA
jgi:LmbE family N-acetylglucosaminyl deacetylase